jgi:hypothetical protein
MYNYDDDAVRFDRLEWLGRTQFNIPPEGHEGKPMYVVYLKGAMSDPVCFTCYRFKLDTRARGSTSLYFCVPPWVGEPLFCYICGKYVSPEEA